MRICIIVDALDECEDLDELGGPKFLGALIETISRLNCHRIKVFVSSRPELIIRNCFESAVRETVDLVKEIQLHDVDGNVVQADIRRFFSHHLSSLARRMNMNLPWPSELEFNALVQRTGGLFVYATTVIGLFRTNGPLRQNASASCWKRQRGTTRTIRHHTRSLISCTAISWDDS